MLVSLCFFFSGAAALILQVLWTRMLGHVFGATALAVSTTLTAFMAGLALGAHVAGKRAPRLSRPLLVFAVLETSVGLYGLLVPGLLGLMPSVQRWIGVDLGLGFIGYSLLRFIIVSAILIIPTTAMGATLPILAEGIVKRGPEIASKVGSLYASNTFGAVVGAFVAGFVLIPDLGIETTVYLAAAIDLMVAVTVVALYGAGKGESLLLRERGEKSADAVLLELSPIEPEDVDERSSRVALIAFALSGGAAMALEVLWTRAVGVVIGASTYAFTLILGTFLVGLSVGAAIVTRYVDRIREPVKALAWVQIAVGGFAVLGTAFVDRLPLWLHSAAVTLDATIGSIYARSFWIAAFTMLPTTLALGAVMPLVVRILAPKGASHAGPIVGRAYAINTLGAILGSFLAGFVILPWLGVQRGLVLASATSLAVGVLLALTRRPILKPVVVSAVLIATASFALPTWDVQTWTAGMFRFYLARSVYRSGWKPSGKVAFHKDGIASTVTVETGEDGKGVSLKVNGKVDASDAGDMPTQILSGLLPVMAHVGPKRVLVIGYGSGVTSGAVLQSPVERVVLVEIEEAVYDASNQYFAHVNHEPPKDPRFSAVIDDGRNYLLSVDEPFDVIISEPSNPWMSGASSLFTQDFFQIARRRLRDDGVYLQWLQLYELSETSIRTLMRTVRSVFPHVIMMTPSPRSNDTLLLAANRPIVFDAARLRSLFEDPKLRRELARAEVDVPEDLFGLYMVGEAEMVDLAGTGPLNTDDNAFIEFTAPKELLEYSEKDANLPSLDRMEGARLERVPEHFRGFALTDPVLLARASDRLVRQGRLADAEAFATAAEAALRSAGSSTTTQERVLVQLEQVEWLRERLMEGDSESVVIADDKSKADPVYARAVVEMVNGDDRQALGYVEEADAFEDRSLAHRLLYAYLCYRRDRNYDADYLLEKVLENRDFVRDNPVVLYYAARVQMALGRYNTAVAYLERFRDAGKPEPYVSSSSVAASPP